MITPSEITELRALRDLLTRLGEANSRHGGNGMTFPDEILLLNHVIDGLETMWEARSLGSLRFIPGLTTQTPLPPQVSL